MTTHMVAQRPENGALSSLIDLSAERAKRRPEEAAQADFDSLLARCDELSKKNWEKLEAAGYSRAATLAQLQAPLVTEIRDVRSAMPLPDLSGLSFDECADVLKALAGFPCAEFGAYGVGTGPLYATINPLWRQAIDHLESIDAKRADRVIEAAINAGGRKRDTREARRKGPVSVGTKPAA